MNSRPLKTRFAPSPTGLLHLGNVRTALFNYLVAQAGGGSFLLRIEDTDAARGHERYIQALQEDLRWLGLEWQEGAGVGGDDGPYLQSARQSIYDQYFAALAAGHHAFICFCSARELELERKTQLAAGRPPRYSGRCYGLSRDEVATRLAARTPATLRFHVEDGQVIEFDDRVRGRQRFSTDDIGDFVIRRSTGAPAFFFSNAVDDALMGVTLVLRGDDHLSNTPRQILMLQALNLPVPDYAHIALVVGPDGAPLSKRGGSRTIHELRDAGFLAAAINNYLARLGHSYDGPELLGLARLAQRFKLTHVSRAPARFDEVQLLHWQQEAVRATPADILWQWMSSAVGMLVPKEARAIFADAVRGNISLPAEAAEWARIVFADDGFVLSGESRKALVNVASTYFEKVWEAYDVCAGRFERFASELKTRTGRTGADAYRPLRLALTGKEHGPELVRLLAVIPAERVRSRLLAASKISGKV